ncbi:MAG TPA: hypothetical protein P5572_19380 [Phycisphaerae bacterium]|nr:hypothetical protein [Phycisphaerales bacterium]HRX87195.1 hypothetical protein [Phycisphaerae bacterium]
MNPTHPKLEPGQRVRIVQQIDRREGDWRGAAEGVLVDVHTRPTGSWYVGKPEGRYPLRRVTIRKDNGELSIISLDEDSQIEILPAAPDAAATS